MAVVDGLSSILKPLQISTDPDVLLHHGRDWTRVHTPNPLAVVFPESSEDVVKIVKWARTQKVALVPSGGRTGLAAGAVAASGEVVLSLDRMNKLIEFSPVDRMLRCQSGMITENVQNAALAEGFYFPVDFASRGSSQIGGNISTNAGGIKVIRYGLMRDWVLSLQVVTGAGELLELNRDLIKNNSGYDLRQLFIGAEGTLGVITEASLRVTVPPLELKAILLGMEKLSDAMNVLGEFQSALSITAFEFFSDLALDYVLRSKADSEPPFQNRTPIYVLIEFECLDDSTLQAATEIFDVCLERGWVRDGAVSQNDQQTENFWAYRELISESLSSFRPYKNDISVRTSKIPAFVADADALLKSKFKDFDIVWFGHIGDGNLHINVIRPSSGMSDAEFESQTKKLSDVLFELLQTYGGSISAEHGIGLLKKPYLHYTRSPQEIALMKAIKKVFDPDNIMNPGKIF